MKLSKNQKKIGKKIRRFGFYPLIIVISSFYVTAGILYLKIQPWTSDMEKVMLNRETEHMILLSQARSQKISSLIKNAYYNLNAVNNCYNSIDNGTIYPADGLLMPNIVNFYEYLENPGEYSSDYCLWSNPYNSSLDRLKEYSILPLFLNFLQRLNKNPDAQSGVILNSGSDYRCPVINTSYILNQNFENGLKNKSYFDSRSYEAYKNNDTLISSSISLHYEEVFTLFLRSPQVTTTNYLPKSFLSSIDYNYNKYEYIITSALGKYVFEENSNSVESILDFNLLFANDQELYIQTSQVLVPALIGNDSGLNLFGFNSEYFASFSHVQVLNESYREGLVVMTYINRNFALNNWNDFLDYLYDKIVQQICVFFAFWLFSVFCYWHLGNFIETIIVSPLFIIENLIKQKNKYYNKEDLNNETLKIVNYLEKLKLLEQYINPNFLLHPYPYKRIQNLIKVETLFKLIENTKGIAIINNLTGNLHIVNKAYEKACVSYREALKNTEKIFEAVLEQKKIEKDLKTEERTIMKKKLKYELSNWTNEKIYLKNNIAERLQQLCLGKRLYLENTQNPNIDFRREWKKLLKMQTKILSHYLESCSNYIETIKVLVDISYSYYKIQAYHTSLDLIEIIADELAKLKMEMTETNKQISFGCDIDIDVSRLKRVNLNIKKEKENKQFFHVFGITFEKPILKQQIFFIRGLIYKENQKFQEAGILFTMAIENGVWYDPEIRKNCVQQLHEIFSNFGLVHEVPLLEDLKNNYFAPKNSVLLCLAYDIEKEVEISNRIIDFTTQEIISQKENFGAISGYLDFKYNIDVTERDYPGLDIEYMIQSVSGVYKFKNIYDLLIDGLKKFPRDSIQNIMIVFIKDFREEQGVSKLIDVAEFLGECKIIIVRLDPDLAHMNNLLIKKYNFYSIRYSENLDNTFEDLRSKLIEIEFME